ncbi:thymidine phosphorylase [Notoacmeibacter sp. MSK16QG-6]|uniref:thymidine phosphorylase n=1 Tax=Notoacmeibacter sp. MSK16QG-6 TaxID=2957982 RepID=UPI00209E5757|nr:thymidine phosphorylase [Notoacmeibacter sp. MSK16QG-6]MCP1198195.1 thymidine phosphorylase [Notoacmeibacter sp. MSK16QG-6]
MLPQEIVRAKRDRQPLEARDIGDFIAGVMDKSVTKEQIAALAMAVYLNGMSRDEAVALTTAMRDSGTVLDWSDLGPAVVDKHSTGGVGDNVSLILAPIVAACGGYVPMISGRGLGHTGGTLDKFESIPGYNVTPDDEVFRRVVKEVGCAIIGQTGSLAPADKVIYGIRDVTATVESVPLITASILSKKLAAGLKGLVLDVKVGSGAFMADEAAARELATSLVEVANGAGMPTVALLTDMDHPLANAAGNAVEVRSAVNVLRGNGSEPRLREITLALAAEMLAIVGIADSAEEGLRKSQEALSSGAAAERFGQMVSALGGPSDFIEQMDEHLPVAPIVRDLTLENGAEYAGRLSFDTRQLGLAVIELGGGRTRSEDNIDHAVGLSDLASRTWDGSSPLCRIHARDEATFQKAADRVRRAVRQGGGQTPSSVSERITA